MKKFVSIVIIAFAVISSFSVYAAGPRMGVAEFSNTSGAHWFHGGVGWELSGMLTNELANSK